MKNLIDLTFLSAIILILVSTPPLRAGTQSGKPLSLKGRVIAVEDGKSSPVPFAVVSFPDISTATSSNTKGEFHFPSIPPGKYNVEVSCLGYETLKREVTLTSDQANLVFTLVPANFMVENVVVSAETGKSVSTSLISRTAMDHLQASSLADVLTLLPGAATTRPTLSTVSLANIRNINSSPNDADRFSNSMGTAVIMDGVPLSNNANLSMGSTAQVSSSRFITTGVDNSKGSTLLTPMTGVDLRNITTDNVESVEVIRGIPSVQYGDLTAGAIIVNSKSGYQPLNVRFQATPNIYSGSVTKGLILGRDGKGGGLNVGADYSYGVSDPTISYEYNQRLTSRLGYTRTFFDGFLYTNTSLNYTYAKDQHNLNPDDEYKNSFYHEDQNTIRFATNGTLNFDKGWFRNITYNGSFSYSHRDGYFEDDVTAGSVAYSLSMTDGAVLSSIPGRDIYDDQGNLISNIPAGEESLRAWMLPDSYLSKYYNDSKELNTFAKVMANFAGRLGPTSHRLFIGADFKNEGNRGKGRTYDPEIPPQRSTNSYEGHRERVYRDIPFMNQLGIFVEENFKVEFANRELDLNAGVRFDKVFKFDQGFSPRFHASLEILPRTLYVSGGYGIAMKSPGLAYLYPDNAYFDMLNFQTTNPDIPAAQQFDLVTTRVYDTSNDKLEMMKQRKSEVGFDLRLGKMRFAVTAFMEKVNNGFTFSVLPENVFLVNYRQYTAGAYPPDGIQLPELISNGDSLVFLRYSSPANNLVYTTRGVEFDFDFGRVDAIRTSFRFNGSYINRKTWNKGYTYVRQNTKTITLDMVQHYGVYRSRDVSVIVGDKFITNLIVTHNIPKIGLVISATANVTWKHKYVTRIKNDSIPVMYIDATTGLWHDFDPDLITDDPDNPFFSVVPNDLRPTRFQYEPALKPVLCVNMNITKQFRDRLDVSFFANNMFMSNRIDKYKYSSGFTRRNSDLFYFGIQLTAKIK